MNKNTVIGMILIAIIMIWWTMSAPKPANRAPEFSPVKESGESLEIPTGNENAPLSLSGTQNEIAIEAVEESDKTRESKDSAQVLSENLAEDSSQIAPPKTILERSFTIETERFIVTLSNRGAKIKSIVAKILADTLGQFPELIEDSSAGALSLTLDHANLDLALFDYDDSLPEKIIVSDSLTLSFTFQDAAGKKVSRIYSFTKDGEAIHQKNITEGFRPSRYALSLGGGMRESESMPKGKTFGANYFFSEVIFHNADGVEREVSTSKREYNESGSSLLWAGLRRKYTALTIQFEDPSKAVILAEPFGKSENSPDPGTYRLTLTDKMPDTLSYDLMVLPLEWGKIKSYGVGYEKIIVSGWQWCGADVWFVAICGFLLWLLKVFYSFIPNYGVAIILLTILVRLITTPLTIKQLRSTRAMSQFKPELDAINVKYRSDPQKRQAAILEFYQKHQINPLSSCTGGCLPLLLQMPIFFGLFMILGRAIELRGQPFFLWISDLSRSDVIWSGLSIPYIMPHGIAILPLVMVFTTYFQTKQSMGAMDPAQAKMMTWMMPSMMFLFSAVMPSGLVLYWIISNVWSIAQYRLINSKYQTVPSKKDNDKAVDAKIIKKK